MNKYLGIFIIVILMSINPFLKRHAMKNITPPEYMTFHGLVISVALIIFVLYLIYIKKFSVNFYKRMTPNQIIFTIVSAILTLVNAMLLVTLLKQYSPTEITPFIDPFVIILVAGIGFFFFKAPFNPQKTLGYITIVAGLFVLAIDIDKLRFLL